MGGIPLALLLVVRVVVVVVVAVFVTFLGGRNKPWRQWDESIICEDSDIVSFFLSFLLGLEYEEGDCCVDEAASLMLLPVVVLVLVVGCLHNDFSFVDVDSVLDCRTNGCMDRFINLTEVLLVLDWLDRSVVAEVVVVVEDYWYPGFLHKDSLFIDDVNDSWLLFFVSMVVVVLDDWVDDVYALVRVGIGVFGWWPILWSEEVCRGNGWEVLPCDKNCVYPGFLHKAGSWSIDWVPEIGGYLNRWLPVLWRSKGRFIRRGGWWPVGVMVGLLVWWL